MFYLLNVIECSIQLKNTAFKSVVDKQRKYTAVTAAFEMLLSRKNNIYEYNLKAAKGPRPWS